MLLLDSLRQGFPIGSFLFLQSSPNVNLSPREFRGASASAAGGSAEELVLDGQQRITAGLELFFGRGTNHYFLDVRKIARMAAERGVNLDDRNMVRAFLADLDAEDGYCRRLKASPNPKAKLIDRHLLWTGLLLDDDELEHAISEYCKAHPSEEKVMRFLIGRNFRPHADANIPITIIDGKTPIEAISRIFSTLNSTGKMLTPFELVVSVLFPKNISLNDDVSMYRELLPYYSKIDETGDILLQTVAIFDGKDTKKASLPKTITEDNYRLYSEKSAEQLEEAAKLISARVGLGLDASSELLVYPVIFTPLAFVMNRLELGKYDQAQRALAEQKLVRWFVGAVLSRRYQQSTHDKQARDKNDIIRWIRDGDESIPEWLAETYVTNIKQSDPDGAVGKLFRSLLNSRNLRDPLSNQSVGVGAGKLPSAKHHIFPTRWVQHLAGWDKKNDSANLALNIMYVTEATNGRWLNTDPREQINESIKILGESAVRENYMQHGINERAFELMLKPAKTRDDFLDFISEREKFFVSILETYGFYRATKAEEMEELDDDDR